MENTPMSNTIDLNSIINPEPVNVADEIVTYKEQYYDLNKYKSEIESFVGRKKNCLDFTSRAEKTYDILYKTIFAGTEEAEVERYPHSAEMYKVYKAALISSCLRGYSALMVITGNDAQSTLLVPQLKEVMTNQFKRMTLLENLTGEILDDWILKGECVTFIKLKDTVEEYRIKEKLTDATTDKDLMSFTVKQYVKYEDLSIERIDPFDFFVDANDYKKDPKGCAKIIRSWITSKDLLTSNKFPLMSKEDKIAIAQAKSPSKNDNTMFFNWWGNRNDSKQDNEQSATNERQIEVLTYYGDYITDDSKVLKNIKAVVVNGKIANLEYNPVNTNRIIYAAYKVDRETHRSISPLAVATPINKLVNKVTDMFIQNLDNVCNPIMLFQKGSMSIQQAKEGVRQRMLEFNFADALPTFYAPPAAAVNGLNLIQMVLDQNKNVLGVNSYNSGDTSGAVRTAREAAVLEQNANARMRVETDVFSYNFLLPLFNAFYAFNRELALVCQNPLNEIYARPDLRVNISTNASRADEEGEFQRLMQMLQLPISQMIFSNLQPDQVSMAVRYIMSKAELKDGDNLLELLDESGNRQYAQPEINRPVNNRGNNGGMR